ncbi:MAG: hypothetical protein KJN89_13785 [Gammaproteobacteria bacterium]|nr:hypothetical protein [Gammaproteobacteria bacterium]MBT8134118.1 hypothetical protein [Gammaproteobacteria bacterium]NNJ51442.1 hypothetical protein [Gammaproteobacteria bacterium]
MKLKRYAILLLVFPGALVFPMMSMAHSLQDLERQCETARERYIAPLRQDVINQCIADRESGNRGSRSSRDARQHCERFYADFGQGGTTQQGGFRQRMFHNIPQCQAFYDAERAARPRR